MVVAFGGDGTVNEAANGLLGSPTPLTCLPGGSANVFAKMLGIPGRAGGRHRAPARAGRRLASPRVDLGVVSADGIEGVLAENRCFTFASGLGVDASVVQRVDANPRLKARLGAYYFTWVALGTFARRYLRQAAAHGGARRRPHAAGRHRRSSRTARRSPTSRTARSRSPTAPRSTPARCAGACCLCHAAVDALDRLARVSRGARVSRHRQVTGLSELTELAVRATGECRCHCRWTATILGEVVQARYSILPGALTSSPRRLRQTPTRRRRPA